MASPAMMRAASARKPELPRALSLLVSMAEIRTPAFINPAHPGIACQKPGSAAPENGNVQPAAITDSPLLDLPADANHREGPRSRSDNERPLATSGPTKIACCSVKTTFLVGICHLTALDQTLAVMAIHANISAGVGGRSAGPSSPPVVALFPLAPRETSGLSAMGRNGGVSSGRINTKPRKSTMLLLIDAGAGSGSATVLCQRRGTAIPSFHDEDSSRVHEKVLVIMKGA